MNAKKILIGLFIALAAGIGWAYSSGFCQKAGCDCHQYYGGSSGQDRCTNCGHTKASHS